MPGEFVLQYAAMVFGWIGAVITIYGGVQASVRIIQREVLGQPLKYTFIRMEFTNKIVFGLEFFIASDILTTLIAPTQEELLLLGTVVVIRVVLGYFLEREAEEFRVD
ncbi:MAG: hypothetical protein APR53_03725 [Methanoculleus sp. SDB]|nr:MAG: hypothetical protein APR53_03725 [Methanoculleus sp. SDB]